MMGAATGLHRHQAAWWQLRAPRQKLVSAQLPVGDKFATSVNGVYLDHSLCQIHSYSCNLAHGTSPFKGFRLTSTSQSWHLMPLPESGESLRISFRLPSSTPVRSRSLRYLFLPTLRDRLALQANTQ